MRVSGRSGSDIISFIPDDSDFPLDTDGYNMFNPLHPKSKLPLDCAKRSCLGIVDSSFGLEQGAKFLTDRKTVSNKKLLLLIMRKKHMAGSVADKSCCDLFQGCIYIDCTTSIIIFRPYINIEKENYALRRVF